MKRFLLPLIAFALLFHVEAVQFTKVQAGRVSHVVGRILEQWHFRQARLDDKTAATFLKNYLNSLDYNHMIFLQSDVDEFNQKYGTKLDDHILSGNVEPAHRIFEVYKERLAERVILVQKLLKQARETSDENKSFTSNDSVLLARNKEPWPKDDAEAARLWKSRITYELLQGRLSKEKPEETLGLIERRYHRLEKTMNEMESDEVLQMYLSALAHAYDPHSEYMSPSEAKNFDIQHISLSLTGIGAQLIWEDGYTKIRDLVAGGPAAKSKQLKPGDKIIAVAQAADEAVDVVEMRLNKVVEMIRGKKGSEVRLTIIPASAPDTKREVRLIRDEIKFKDQMARARVFERKLEDGRTERLGVVTLPQFYDNCASHVEKLIERLKQENVKALVLDLRRNGGGILDEAVQLTGLFIKKGPVVQVKEPKRQPQVLEDRDSDVAWDGPLVVLVGKLSASASEIVAGALQDYGRAVIVGDQSTHGKGTVQQVLRLDNFLDPKQVEDPGNLKMTVSKFYRVAGSTTQKQGVTPDIILPSIYDYLEIGEASLDNPLQPDSTTPAEYTKLDLVKPYLTELQNKSKSRVAQNQDFAYMLEDIAQVKKRQEDKRVSLNEAVLIKEREENKKRLEARKKERAKRDASGRPAILDLSLEAVDKEQPLELFTGVKKDEDEQAAAATENADPEAAVIEEDEEAEPFIDAQLTEGLSILRDYSDALSRSGKLSANNNVAATQPKN